MPEAHQYRKDEGKRKCIECVKEGRAAHDDTRLGVPSAERHVLDAKQQVRSTQLLGHGARFARGWQGRRRRRSKGCSCCLLKSCILWALDFLLVLKHRSRCFLTVSRRRRFLGRFPILLWATRETRFRTSPLRHSADSEAGWRFAIVITAIGARIPRQSTRPAERSASATSTSAPSASGINGERTVACSRMPRATRPCLSATVPSMCEPRWYTLRVTGSRRSWIARAAW